MKSEQRRKEITTGVGDDRRRRRRCLVVRVVADDADADADADILIFSRATKSQRLRVPGECCFLEFRVSVKY
jgi:hypothetical protein